MPLAQAGLRLQIDSTIVATDATPAGGASDAVVPRIIVEDVYRCAAEHSGERARFGDDHIFESVFRSARMTPLDEELEALTEKLAWRDLGG